MSYKGRIANGTIVLDEAIDLPEGASVRVVVVPEDESEPLHPDIIRFTGILPENIDARDEYVEGMRKKHR